MNLWKSHHHRHCLKKWYVVPLVECIYLKMKRFIQEKRHFVVRHIRMDNGFFNGEWRMENGKWRNYGGLEALAGGNSTSPG
jgi:hypothetical protein